MLWNKKDEGEDRLPDLPFQARQIKNNQNSQIIENSDSKEEHFESIRTSEKQSLPSFPDSPIEKGFSQSAIKEAVSNQETEKIPLPPAQEELNFLSDNLKIQKRDEIEPTQNTFIQPNPFLNESVVPERKEEPKVFTKMRSENKPLKLISVPHDYPQDAPHPPIQNKIPSQRIENPPIDIPKIDYHKDIEYSQEKEIVKKEEYSEKIEEKTTDVFVKIDKFYSAKKALSGIKQNVKEIENLLSKIRETKIKEERELANWEKNISSVKEEINKVNESLFEKLI